jgi:hypothetical protein
MVNQTGDTPEGGNSSTLTLGDVIAAALETKPMTSEERKALDEEYRQRERKSPGRKKAGFTWPTASNGGDAART